MLRELAAEGVDWIQIDEPILAVDAPKPYLDAFPAVYKELANTGVRIIIGTYFASVAEHLNLLKTCRCTACTLMPYVRKRGGVCRCLAGQQSAVGGLDRRARNVWRANLSKVIDTLAPVAAKLGNNLWIAPSCSLLHSPQDLAVEEKLDAEIKS